MFNGNTAGRLGKKMQGIKEIIAAQAINIKDSSMFPNHNF